MRTAVAVLILLTVAAAASADPPTPADPTNVSLAEAMREFRERGFDLLLADAGVASAEGDLTTARAFPNPIVAGGSGHNFNYDPHECSSDCSRTPWSASVSDQGLLFDLLIGKRRLKVDVATEALAAARLSRADAERTLTALVEQSWVDAVVARALLGTSREASEAAGRTADLVKVRFRAGDVAEADVARAETSRLEAEQSVDAAAQAYDAARADLAFLIGVRDGSFDFDVAPRLPEPGEPPELSAATVDSLIRTARAKRPDLAAAQAQVASAESALALARRQRLPDIALTAGYNQNGSGQEAIQPPTATVGLSLPLPIFDRNAGGIQKAEASLRAQSIARDKLDAQVATEVSSALAAHRSALARVQRSESGLLASAQRARELVEYQYKKGAASLLELLDAQRNFVATQAEYFQSLGDYWISRYRIEAAIGKEVTS